MTQIRVNLEVSTTDLVAREDPSCRLTVVNEGTQILEVPNLDMNPEWPRFVVEDLGTGAAQSFDPKTIWAEMRVKPMPSQDGEGPMIGLGPGESKSWIFNLSHRIRLLFSGGYSLHARLWVEGQTVRSNAVVLRIVPVESVRSSVVYAHGGFADTLFEGWVGNGEPALYLRAVCAGVHLEQEQSLRLCSLPAVVDPILSVAPNAAAAATRTVAWLEGNAIHAIDAGIEGVTRPQRSVALSWPARFIVPHLWKDPETDDCSALVWSSTSHGDALVPVIMGEHAIQPLDPVMLSLPQPVWIRSFFASTGERHVLFLVGTGGRLELWHLSYGERLVITSKPMHVWECGLLGIAAHMDPDDNIRGVLVGQRSSSDPTAPAIIFRWSVEVGGRSVAEPPSVWAGLDQHLLEHFQLAIDVHGIPHALVRWSEDEWWCLTPETRHAVIPPYGASISGLPMLRFMADGTIPLLLWHDLHRGLLGAPLGIALPDFLGKDFIRPALADS